MPFFSFYYLYSFDVCITYIFLCEELVRDILREYVIQMANKKLSVIKLNEQLEFTIIERLTP